MEGDGGDSPELVELVDPDEGLPASKPVERWLYEMGAISSLEFARKSVARIFREQLRRRRLRP